MNKTAAWSFSIALSIQIAMAATPVTTAPPVTRTYKLGRAGEIPRWLTLGYLPGVETAETDRLAAVGGEATAQPYGGETVTFPAAAGTTQGLALVWSMIEAQQLEIPWAQISTPGVYRFIDQQGKAVAPAAAYLYCGLESAVAQRLAIRFCGDEPVRVWFNGEKVPVTESMGNRCEWNRPPHPLEFKKGLNHLLVRLDNRSGDEFFFARLTTETGEAVTGVKAAFREAANMPRVEPRLLRQEWDKVVAELPPVPPSADEAFFGVNLGRTLALLETGGQTKRPVRILFYGQSITASEWVWLLVRQLRARYPHTTIEAENWAISGWGIHRLYRTIKHDILRKRPDLVVLHAYGGGSWEWERILQTIRRETSAEIMIRSAHIDRGHLTRPGPLDSVEARLLRRLARTYGCELVEGRREWLDYMDKSGLRVEDLTHDAIHLNRRGAVLMAQLYERHFRPHPAARPWFDTVRRYEAMRPLADRRHDEVRLIGDGWHNRPVNCAVSTGASDSLTLRFTGNRVDLIMPPHNTSAKVLIDGRPPSAWNLFAGTRPAPLGKPPGVLMTYHMGTNMVEETWTLTFTHSRTNGLQFRYALAGSETGPDGEGDSGAMFVSISGRIKIDPADFLVGNGGPERGTPTDLEPVQTPVGLTWRVRPLYPDEVQGVPLRPGEPAGDRYSVPYRYVTIVDALPPGEHELTLIPAPGKSFAIEAVEVHRPPLGR